MQESGQITQEPESGLKVRMLTKLRSLCFRSDYIPEPVWRWLPVWLVIAFVLRATLALSGDFVLHPDEIMQHLEPAHRLVFGNGIVYWEFFYGARNWLVPGLIAGVLWLSDAAGLGEPWFYVDAVKLMFCLLSLLIPWGVYHYSRSIISEAAARLALILACVWPYLLAYAHKPFTEFVATDLLLFAFGLAALPASRRTWSAAGLGFLIALAGFIRYQYMPIAGLLWLAKIITLKPRSAVAMLGGSLLAVVAVAMLEWYSWGGFFHSYRTNFLVNLELDLYRSAQPVHFYIPRLVYATCGGILVAVWAMARDPRRYFLLMVCMLVLFSLHSFYANHKEFRFIFLLMPLWLIPFAGWVCALRNLGGNLKILRLPVGLASAFSLLILLNALPFENWLHQAESKERGEVNYLRGQSNLFELYRLLADTDDVTGVVHIPDQHFNTPGYYYLHNRIPFYDFSLAHTTQQQYGLDYTQLTSHIVTNMEFNDPSLIKILDDPEYKLYVIFPANAQQVIGWKSYNPTSGLGDNAIFNEKIGNFDPPPQLELELENQ